MSIHGPMLLVLALLLVVILLLVWGVIEIRALRKMIAETCDAERRVTGSLVGVLKEALGLQRDLNSMMKRS